MTKTFTVDHPHPDREFCRFCDPDSPDYLRYAHWALMTSEERTDWTLNHNPHRWRNPKWEV